jgi:ribonuclease P protein component
MRLETLKRSAEFHRVRGGLRVSTARLVIEAKARETELGEATPGASQGAPHAARSGGGTSPRVGFTITRKLGGAVVRNRIRRRLREVLRPLMGTALKPGFDYVIVARPPVLAASYSALRAEIEACLGRLHASSAQSGWRPVKGAGGGAHNSPDGRPKPPRDTLPRASRLQT